MSRLTTRLPLVSALALITSAGLAHAADLYAPVPVSNWSGFYAGSLIGYGWTDAELTSAVGPADLEGSFDGATAGAVVGYNWQSGNWVYGLEGDLTLHEIRGGVGADGIPGDVADVDSLYSGHLRARIGYDFGRFLPYIAGGLAVGETYAHLNDPAPSFIGDNQRMMGWTVGAGLDFKLGETFIGPVILRAEYVYEDFSSEAFNILGDTADIEHSTHFARLGLISYLGGDSAPVFDGQSVDWSGPYGGLMLGYSRHNVETTDSLLGGSGEIEADGVLGGIYTGRNFQFGNFVLGIEGSIALTEIEGSGPYFAGPDHDYRGNIQADARARIGYAFGNFLPFISGGVLWTRSEQTLDTGGPFDLRQGRLPAVAWTVGAGVDYRLSERWSLRGEYVYALDDDAKTPDFGIPDTEQEIEIHQVRFGTAYHF